MPKNIVDPFKNARTPNEMKITSRIAEILESIVKGIKSLNHREGGNRNNLRLVHNIFRTLAEYVRSNNATDAHTQQRLLAAWAHLCQSGGFMAFDANLHGLAQRYWFTGLQITHTIGDQRLGAYILGLLSFQAASRGHANDASQLGEAAIEAAAKSANSAVQALATSRYAQAQAAAGNAYSCQAAMDKARELFSARDASASIPGYLSWFDSRMLESQSGYNLLVLAQSKPRNLNRLLGAADDLLAPHMVGTSDFSYEFPRDALFWGSWHARSYVWRDELEQAIKTGAVLLDLLRGVRSPRTLEVLRRLDKDLAQHRGAARKAEVVEFRHQLNTAIASAA